ncbi:dynamin family protein [Arthrobacter roseus]|uniref:dynamin family protein n=1 Tax=Arthrobacter roseus TaxID=136274 RepID=UPI001965C5AA|nr:dynamin family protein [Arthrobacter roseus]MBM7848910.1 energy-coupling factor transporter ATP-binding protein EcfA2 [Arthrobacter roseus]
MNANVIIGPRDSAAGSPTAILDNGRRVLGGVTLSLELPGVVESRAISQAAVDQIYDYILPRYRSLDASLLAVVGGSTGAGKSTLVNALAGHPVTRSGAIRPTTRQPILLHHPSDRRWFADQRILPSLSRVTGVVVGAGEPSKAADQAGADPDASAIGSLVMVGDEQIPEGVALLDAPDIDSISDDNRRLSGQLLSAADLWLFVTTANRYADAVPWKLLLDAASRDILVAVVLDRVPEGVADEITEDLTHMLQRQGLGEAQVFVVPETPLDELGMLPPESVQPIRDWLIDITKDAAGRAAIARRTLTGAVKGLADKVTVIAEAADSQQKAANRLAEDAETAYQDAVQRILDSTKDGTLLRGEVLARWQDFVGTGEFFRSFESGIGRLRDRIGSFFTGKPTPAITVETAIETGLQAVIVDQAAKAAEQADQRWRDDPAGRSLLKTTDMSRLPANFSERAASEIRAWQGDLLTMIQKEGANKRFTARMLSFGVNGLAVALMVVVFATTAGLTGLEIGIAGGSAIVGQKVLEAVFGEDAVRRLAATARKDLHARCVTLLGEEKRRFLELLGDASKDGQAQNLHALAAELKELAQLTGQATPDEPNTGDQQ